MTKIEIAINDLGLAINNAKFDSAMEANAVKEKFNQMASLLQDGALRNNIK